MAKITIEPRRLSDDSNTFYRNGRIVYDGQPTSTKEGNQVFLIASQLLEILEKIWGPDSVEKYLLQEVEIIKAVYWIDTTRKLMVDFQIVFSLSGVKINFVVHFRNLDYGPELLVYKDASHYVGGWERISKYQLWQLNLSDERAETVAKGLILAIQFAIAEQVSAHKEIISALELASNQIDPFTLKERQ